jgi:hypothetical protein
VLLHAKRLTGDECEPAWLRANADALRRWYTRIEVVHSPPLTMRVLDTAWQIAAGRDALRALNPLDLLRLARDYRNHYGSSLLDARDLIGWVRAAIARVASGSTAPPPGDYLPIYFPNRIELRFTDGTVATGARELQTGSMAAPTMPAALEQKFLRECSPRLGADQARAALQLGLSLDGEPLPRFISLLAASPSSAP